MGALINILIVAAVLAVMASLGLGLFSLYRGGEFARKHSNRLMRLRVGLQAVAVLLVVVGIWWKSTHGA